VNTGPPTEEAKKEESVESEVAESLSDDNQQPSTSPKSDKQDDPKRPMDPNSVPPQRNTTNTSTEERTSELIRKQMNEIGEFKSCF
jgi:hypothetical protein